MHVLRHERWVARMAARMAARLVISQDRKMGGPFLPLSPSFSLLAERAAELRRLLGTGDWRLEAGGLGDWGLETGGARWLS